MTNSVTNPVTAPMTGVTPDDLEGLSQAHKLLRGRPRDGENWNTQGLTDVLIARAELVGLRAAVSRPDYLDRQILMVATRDAAQSRRAIVMGSERDDWTSGGIGRDFGGKDVEAVRTEILNRTLSGVGTMGANPTVDVLVDPYKPRFSIHHRLDAVVQLWWQARLDEGHTPESAQAMLGLLAHPSVVSMLEQDEAGVPRARPFVAASVAMRPPDEVEDDEANDEADDGGGAP